MTQDAVAQKVTIDAETRAALAASCRTWFQVRIVKHEDRVGITREWEEHGDGSRGYVYAPAKVSEETELLDARVGHLEIEGVVKALYGPMAP